MALLKRTGQNNRLIVRNSKVYASTMNTGATNGLFAYRNIKKGEILRAVHRTDTAHYPMAAEPQGKVKPSFSPGFCASDGGRRRRMAASCHALQPGAGRRI